MKRNFLLLLLLTSASIILAQGSNANKRKIAQLEAQGHLIEAAQLYISMHNEGVREATLKAAMALYQIGKYKEALVYFQKADSLGVLDQNDQVFGYFECLKSVKKYKEADQLIQTHVNKNMNAPELQIHADKEKFYERLMGYGRTIIKTVPINSIYSEFGPTVLDGWLYFESTRVTKENSELHGLNNQAFFNLYAHPIGDPSNAVVMPQGNFGKSQVSISSGGKQTLSIPADINKSHHDGPVYLSPEGKHMFYTTNWDHQGKTKYKNPYLNLSYSSTALENSEKKEVGKLHLNIYYSTRENNVWSEPVSFPYNNDAWSNQHAFFDEKTNTLYFSSNMPGGLGGFDIWRSVIMEDQWTKPENLGPNVNTVKNEGFPTLSTDGYLIFASNGWPGLGGLDLFVSEYPDQQPINLMAGLNTEMDDFGMTFISKGKGYLVSNRKESVGDDDIFEFEIILDDILEFNKPAYQLMLADASTGAKIPGSVVLTQRGAKRTLQVAANGQDFRLADPKAQFEASAEGYFPAKMSFKDYTGTGPVVISLQPVPAPKPEPTVIEIVPIYFDYNKANIRKDAAADLDNLVETLNGNPTLTIEASSHTDCRGTDSYNQKLSERRLKATLDYLKKKVINPERLNGVGLGETKPANPCDCEKPVSVRCEEAVHQKNRRTEFMVVKY